MMKITALSYHNNNEKMRNENKKVNTDINGMMPLE
jgi:hypothetical protein